MQTEPTESREKEAGPEVLEELGSFAGGEASAEGGRPRPLVKIQVYLPRKDAILLDEIRLRHMKRGRDVTRSWLVSEGIHAVARQESEPKTALRGS